jgi:VanZ family protein
LPSSSPPRGAAPRLRAWLAVVAWALLISTFSTGWFSGEQTGNLLLPILRALLPWAQPEHLDAIHAVIRKAAHVVEYLVLGILLVRALREEGLASLPLALVAILLGSGWAALDEFHQEFVPSRTASPRDVAVDTSGVCAGVALALARRRHVLAPSASAATEN